MTRTVCAAVLAVTLAFTFSRGAENPKSKKVFVITDMEGVSGIFDTDLQCLPFQSPRFEKSRKLLTGEINAAVDGLFEGGAMDVVVWDGQDASRTVSVLDIHPKVRLLAGEPVSPTLELDPSYDAVIFMDQHAMAGAEKGILSHSYDPRGIQNIWVNNRPTGEIGARVIRAGSFGIPAIMLSGDTAACKAMHDLVPQAECAEVKSDATRTAGFRLPHATACALIRERARRAMERLPEFKPYKISGPVEVKVEFTPRSPQVFRPREGVEQLNDGRGCFVAGTLWKHG